MKKLSDSDLEEFSGSGQWRCTVEELQEATSRLLREKRETSKVQRKRNKSVSDGESFSHARLNMFRHLSDLHALAEALDDAENLGDVIDEAFGIAEEEAREAIKRYIACALATQR